MTGPENVQEWIKLIEVDWLGQYAKTWMAFNAWYRSQFGKEKNDGKIIEKIKNDEEEICSEIENFLSGSGAVEKAFQSDIAELHDSLVDKNIKSKGTTISFEAIEDYQYTKDTKSIEENRRGITYKITIHADNKQRVVRVENASGENIFDKTITAEDEESFQGEKWFEKLSDSGWFEKLSQTQRNYLRADLEDSSPIHNLLDFSDNFTEIGSYKFTSDKKLIARALIEILYQLRNSLFHGELTPTPEVQKAYEPAYLILKWILLRVANRSKNERK